MADYDKDLLRQALEKRGSNDFMEWLVPEEKLYSDATAAPVPAEPASYSSAPSEPVESRLPAEPEPPPAEPTAPAQEPMERSRGVDAIRRRAERTPPEPVAAPTERAPVAPPAEGEVPTDEQLLDANRPAPAGPAPEPAVTSRNDGVEDLPLDLSKSTRVLQTEVAEGQKRGIDLVGEQASAAEARGATERELEAARSETGVSAIEDARAREERQLARGEENRDDQRAQMEELKRQIKEPPFDTVGMVFGIVSALAASQGKGAAAQAFTALGQAVNHRMQKYKGGIEAGEKNLEGLGQVATADRIAALDEDAGADLLNRATAAEFSLALDHVKQQARTEAEVNAATQLENQLAQAAKGGELKRRQAAAEAERARKINAELANATTEAERTHIAHQYGPLGRKLYGQMLKTSKDQTEVGGGMLGNELKTAQIGKTQAEAAKLDAESKAGPEQGPAFGGYRLPNNLPPSFVSKVGDGSMAMATVQEKYKRLIELSEDVKSGKTSRMDPNVAGEISDIRNQLVSLRTQLAGAGAPTGKEYDTTLETIADPQKMFQRADSRNLLVRALQDTNRNWEARMKVIGATKEAPGASPEGGTPSKVRVRAPDGSVMMVSPSAAAALRKISGYSPADDSEE